MFVTTSVDAIIIVVKVVVTVVVLAPDSFIWVAGVFLGFRGFLVPLSVTERTLGTVQCVQMATLLVQYLFGHLQLKFPLLSAETLFL